MAAATVAVAVVAAAAGAAGVAPRGAGVPRRRRARRTASGRREAGGLFAFVVRFCTFDERFTNIGLFISSVDVLLSYLNPLF